MELENSRVENYSNGSGPSLVERMLAQAQAEADAKNNTGGGGNYNPDSSYYPPKEESFFSTPAGITVIVLGSIGITVGVIYAFKKLNK